jgi:hypothetical protein
MVATVMVVLSVGVTAAGVSLHAWAGGAPGGRRRALAGAICAAAWLALTGAAAASGVLAEFERRPPPFMLLFPALLAVGLGVGLSSVGARLARGVPLAALVGLQAFRLPLELTMHHAADIGLMPAQMTFGGFNYDIVTGATAAVLALQLARGRAPAALVAAWNVLGLVLLAVVVVVGVASTPLLHAFGTQPERLNTWVARFPYVWLPAVLVVAALAGHIVIFRALAPTAAAPARLRAPGAPY